MKKIYIHTGMPKSASTFLQHQFYPFLNGVHYIGREGDRGPITPIHRFIKFTINYQKKSIEEFKLSYEKLKYEFWNYINTLNEEKILISSETFVGLPSIDGFESFIPITNALKFFFPNAKILLIIRNQPDLFESDYSFQFRKGYAKSINKYLNFYNGKFNKLKLAKNIRLNRNKQNTDILTCDYLKFYKYYTEKFGIENVTFIPFELLKRDKDNFFKEIINFLKLPQSSFFVPEFSSTNRAYSTISANIARYLNPILSKADPLWIHFENIYLCTAQKLHNHLGTAPHYFFNEKKSLQKLLLVNYSGFFSKQCGLYSEL